MKSKEKVCLVIPTLVMGGAERVMSELANSWARQGFEVNILLLVRRDRFYKLNSQVQVLDLDLTDKENTSGLLRELKIFRQLRRTIKKIKPSFVLSFMTKYNSFTILASLGLGIPVYVSDRSNPRKKLSKWVVNLRKMTYPLADGVWAQTSAAKDFLIESVKPKSVSVIPNPLRELQLTDEIEKEKIILNVGRLVQEKGHIYLLEAFAKLNRPDWRLVILGDGELRDELEDMGGRLDIADRLHMPGAVNNVDSWLQRASIFAFTSISEGFPNALSEAMGAGMACVSFDCMAGPSDLIQDGHNGFLVEAANTGELVERLETLMADQNLRVQLGKEAMKSSFNLNKELIAQRVLDFCRQNS